MLHKQMTERASAQLEIDYLRDELKKAQNGLKLVRVLKENLKKFGYYAETLWCVDDITEEYDCTEEQAYEILKKVMTSTAITEQIFLSIQVECDKLSIPKID